MTIITNLLYVALTIPCLLAFGGGYVLLRGGETLMNSADWVMGTIYDLATDW